MQKGMRKRGISDGGEESSSEMDVDNEEKVEGYDDESSDDDDDDEEMIDNNNEQDLHDAARSAKPGIVENPFLDSFYNLASEDLKERSKAAQTMLHQCLLSSSANCKDAAYAFRRLLNGICSGRAAARQGNASALASFLKLAFHLGKMQEIREEAGKLAESESMSLLAYVRHRLIAATDPNQITGKKKGSEERDYQFGRLFGVLAIVRSNILSSEGDHNGYEETKLVATALAVDLTELFWLKKWMREPAAHGITTLLRTFSERKSAAHKDVANHLVEKVVIPKLLLVGSNGEESESDHTILVGSFCAEQLGVALFVQSQPSFVSGDSSFPLDQAVMSKATVVLTAQALSETSSVVLPRTHFVWDSLWCYFFSPTGKSGSSNQKGSEQRFLRDYCPGGQENPIEVLDLVIREVVMQKLLRLDPEKNSGAGKATHERRALALGIIKVLLGVQYASSAWGPSRLILGAEVLENSILTPEIIKTLFLEIICAGSDKKKTSHLLKPLAINTLNEVAEALAADDSDVSQSRRLAIARALLSSEIRFDARTKTSTVSTILGLVGSVPEGKATSCIAFWNGYVSDLESRFLDECSILNADGNTAKITGLIELIYSFTKNILSLQVESKTEQLALDDFKKFVAERTIQFFLAVAFFNCKDMGETPSKVAKKNKGKKASQIAESDMQKISEQLKHACSQSGGIAHPVRSVVSARFFSILADYCGYATRPHPDDEDFKIEKDAVTLAVLVKVCANWKALETLGAKRYCSSMDNQAKDEDESVDPEKMIIKIQKMVNSSESLAKDSASSMATSKKRCCTGIGVLAYSLYLHRLSCGESDQDGDNPDADDENDEEEICNALEGLKDVANDFVGQSSEEDSNPLLGLAETCANILSSPLGSGNMGRAASPKLVREAVKFAWLGSLRLASELASNERSFLDSSVMTVLLEAVGAVDNAADQNDEASDDDDDDAQDDNSSVDSADDNVFTKAIDMDDDADEADGKEDSDDDSDIELDHTKLQSMLEEDSDADIGEDILEHHEGADAALAKFIKLKQESRKVGRQAREKIEIEHQLRCTFLLELLFNRPDGCNRIFKTDVLVGFLLPILKYRKKLERSLAKSIDSGTESSDGRKQALLDRLTMLLNQKICKLKISSFPFAKPLSEESALDYATKILAEARRADGKQQASCCSSCLVFCVRSSKSPAGSLQLMSAVADAVSEWSTKRTSKLQASLFDDFILHLPDLAQAFLAEPLSKATKSARSPFLKCECFRLMTQLFSTKSDGHVEDKMESIRNAFMDAVETAIQDEEMRRAKRVRFVLKALEKFIATLAAPVSSKTCTHLETIKSLLENLGEGESQGVSSMCTKLIGEMDAKITELRPTITAKPTVEETKKNDVVTAKVAPSTFNAWDVSKSKKGKKNKKKKR